MADGGISGIGVGLMAAGGLVAWAGINNAGILESLRELAKGNVPPKHPNEPFQNVGIAEAGATAAVAAATTGRAGAIVSQAQKHLHQHPYKYGGGHGQWNCSAGTAQDCSGFASCVLHELGLLNTPLNTTAFLAWNGATTVQWAQRGPGDLIIWSSHMGIAVSASEMIHTGGAPHCPCQVPYTQLRSGRKGVARRVK